MQDCNGWPACLSTCLPMHTLPMHSLYKKLCFWKAFVGGLKGGGVIFFQLETLEI